MKKIILLFAALCVCFVSCILKMEEEKPEEVIFEGNPEAFAYTKWESIREYTEKIEQTDVKHKDIITMSFYEDGELIVNYSYTESGFETESKERYNSIYSVQGDKLTLELVERGEIVETLTATIKGKEFSYTGINDKNGKMETYLFHLKNEE